MKKWIFAVVFVALAASTAWAQNNDVLPAAPGGINPGYYYFGSPFSPPPSHPAYNRVDPTAHYWDYYAVELGRGIDADRTTPP